MRRLPTLCLLLLLSLLLAACASGGGARGVPRAGSGAAALPPPDASNTEVALAEATDYRIGGMDLLSISVFGVDALSKEVRVNAKGQISLPLIGTVPAAGMTTQELEIELKRRYSANYLQNPQVSVFVKEFASQRVTMEGALGKPGIYPISGKITLLQAIALAGGLDEQTADPRGIVIMRQVNGRRMAAAYDLRMLRNGSIEDPQLYGDDIVVVEESGSKTVLRKFLDAMPIIGLFRWL
ncbi:polysaccharide biosynthesis/export family protein [Thermomonas sp.]|uniref:polysaccharide biosynthesis/export family protein n=1 Tax=Thermomonas sp. TaxID=1971895 RepID=UPI0026213505|nr:polysaccharide biosynthesis/export family protein [Thermomonas sp.]MCO5054663.1 polysaccharide export protein [Thermomonas sp.]